MAKTPEGAVKAAVKKLLDEMGIYHFSPVQNGMGRAGIPDIIGCFRGRFLGIECKAGKGKTTALQDLELEKIRQAKGFAYVVNETNIQDLKELLIWMR
jgi:Holliday junction resolvase